MKRKWLKRVAMLAATALLLGAAGSAAGQKNKKKDDKAAESQTPAPPPVSDEQLIDTAISEMLAGWQIGDMDLLHKHYAEDCIFISGGWEPAAVGWEKYAVAFKAQRARMERTGLDRTNTYIVARGNTAWVTYLWNFRAEVDKQPTAAQGHTTLVFEKRNGVWLIVLNHTSVVAQSQGRAATPAAPNAKPGP